eukprot:Rhum_TRINITY_DN3950_c0_g1::Rhum_TRINITY_DN3950_c0_g1_i1::g.12520::m.12520
MSKAPAGNDVAVRSTTASGVSGSAVYETAKAVEEYLQFHYGGDVNMPYAFGPKEALDFPRRCGEICNKFAAPDRRRVAYDIGCSVGATTFELSKSFEKVVGVDFSHGFIDAAKVMRDEGKAAYRSTVVADVRKEAVAVRPEGAVPERVEFRQGDACNLGDIGEVDCFVAANLLCRLPDPIKYLEKGIECTAQGGIFVLISPFSWLPEYTEKSKWIGGTEGCEDSAEACRKILEPHFELVHEQNEPFLIREHERKYQYGVSLCSVWRKK